VQRKARKQKKKIQPIATSQSAPIDDGKIKDFQQYKIMLANIFNN